jgi:hypothetical protein
MSALAACLEGRQWLAEHFRLQGTAVLKENSDDLHLIAEKPRASAARAGQWHRRAPAPIGCHLQRVSAICSALLKTLRKYIFWQNTNTGINMTFKQVVLSQAPSSSCTRVTFRNRFDLFGFLLCGNGDNGWSNTVYNVLAYKHRHTDTQTLKHTYTDTHWNTHRHTHWNTYTETQTDTETQTLKHTHIQLNSEQFFSDRLFHL